MTTPFFYPITGHYQVLEEEEQENQNSSHKQLKLLK
jgi:hypothetical protein